MKYLRFFFALALLAFTACETASSDKAEQSKEISPFNVSLDMTVEEVKELYSDYDFLCAPANNHGLCGGGEVGFEVLKNDTVLFFFWEEWDGKELGGFILYDPKQSYENIYTGMGLNDYLEKNPNAETVVSHLDSKESIPFNNGNCWINLDSEIEDYAAEYTFQNGEYIFKRYVDTDKKIESIFVTKSS